MMSKRDLRVVTYNIRHGLGMDGRIDLMRIASILREIDGDIVCLQEVDIYSPASAFARQSRRLAKSLRMSYCFGRNFRLGFLSGMGNAILLKTPLYSTWNTQLPAQRERRGLLYAKTEIDSAPLHVFNTHWGLTAEQRTQQATACAERIVKTAENGPVIFCGDLNAALTAPEIQRLLVEARLAHSDALELLPTYPSDLPKAAIDHIFTSSSIVIRSGETMISDASDHLPAIADISLK